MSRYENSKVKKDQLIRGKNSPKSYHVTSYSTTIYSSIPETNSDVYVITQKGDRLDNLAAQFYGDSNLWWYIAQANNLNTMNIEAGIQLRIPMSKENAKGR